MMAVSCTSLPPSHGGYECDFADPIPDSFSCPVCLLPFRDPHLVSCCGAKYCAQCIGRVKAAGQACPLCKQEFNTMLDRSLQRKILELKVFCSRKDECQWIGQLRHLDRHEREECGRGMVECSYQCGVRLPRRLMAEHQREMCPRRPMNSKIEVLLQKMEERHKREMAVLREEFRNSLTEERMDHTKEVEGLKQLVVEQKKAIERQLGTKKVGYADIKIAEGSHIKKEIEDLKMSTENKMAEQKEKERQFMHSKLSIHRWETDDRLTRHKKEVDGQIDSKMAEHWRGTDKQLEIRMVELKKETERHVESKMTEQRIPIELQLEYKMTEQKKASERQFEYKMAEQKKTLERQFESKITEQKKTTERHLESKMAELKKETERQMQSKIAEVKKETERQMQSKMAEVKKETERQMQSKMAEVKKETERQMQSKVAELRKETESKMAEQKKESERRLQSKMAEHIKETERQMQSKVAEHIKETERPVESKNAEQKINRPVKAHVLPTELLMKGYMEKSYWHSPPFYTEPVGYKLCIKVSKSESGTHMSLYVYIMRGEYDSRLEWPFKGSITIQLVNHKKPEDNHEVTLRFSEKPSNRVTSGEMAKSGWGFARFISYNNLKSSTDTRRYIIDDCLTFRVTNVLD